MDLFDTIIGRYYGFSVASRHFYLYPVTLGKMFLLRRLIEELHLNTNIIKANPYIEALRISTENKEVCCRILTYHTINTKAKMFDNEFVEKRTRWLVENIDYDALAQAMMMVLQSDKTEMFMKYLKLDKERERMERVMQVKKDKNNINFGGLSVYGTYIDTACERYGWTFDYVVWEISYSNLMLLMADKLTSIYVSDDEMKKLPASVFANKANMIKADDPKNRDMIRQMDWR